MGERTAEQIKLEIGSACPPDPTDTEHGNICGVDEAGRGPLCLSLIHIYKPRRISCTFTRGKIRGAFTAILLGSADSTSLECTLDVEGLGPVSYTHLTL